jgi:hypothetical protein
MPMVEEIKQERHVDMRTWSKAWNGFGWTTHCSQHLNLNATDAHGSHPHEHQRRVKSSRVAFRMRWMIRTQDWGPANVGWRAGQMGHGPCLFWSLEVAGPVKKPAKRKEWARGTKPWHEW